jgi:uncharacterized membrane protein
MEALRRLSTAAFYCHRIPERSFHVCGQQLPVCSRCCGLAVGYLVGLALVIATIEPRIWLPVLLTSPLVLDGFGQLNGLWVSNNPRRLVTGIACGIGLVFIVETVALAGFRHGQLLGLLLK